MPATEAPPDRAPRTVYAVASGAIGDDVREAIDKDPALELGGVAESFTDLVTARGFPGHGLVLVEEPGPALVAHAHTGIAAGAVVVVIASVQDELAEKLYDTGAAVYAPGMPMSAVTAKLATANRPKVRQVYIRPSAGSERPNLSPSERRALAYYAQGYSTSEVAAAMGVGYETAKTFLRRVRKKYAAIDRPAGKRAELITRAEEDGLI